MDSSDNFRIDRVVESVKMETNLQQLINWREGQNLIVYKGCRSRCENRDDSFNYTHQHMHIYYLRSLKFTLKHLKRSYMFR